MRIKLLCVLILALVLTLGFSMIALGTSKPIITSVSPASGNDNEVVQVTIDGEKFHKSAQVKLSKDGESDIIASNVTLVSSKQIVCTFDLNGKDLGQWNLVVTNTGKLTKKQKVGTLTEAFTINASSTVEESTVEPETPQVEPETEPAEVEEEEEAEVDPNSLLESVFFDFDKADLRQDYEETMEYNLNTLKEYAANNYIILGGHADERGPNDYNLKLSAKRAETIKNYLVANGIAANKIVIYAYGEESPAKTGSDEESWSYNRRVDIAIWEELPSKEDALKE